MSIRGQPIVGGAVAAGVPVVEPLTWVSFGSAETGFGFRDNVLLSHAGEERSSFVRGGVDATVWRVPQGRIDYLAVMSVAGTRYFSAKTVNKEAQAIVLTEWRYRIGDVFRFSVEGRAYHFDQIYDASDTDLQKVVAEVKTSGVAVGPMMKRKLFYALWIEASVAGKRETFPDGVNNRSMHDGSLRLSWRPVKRLEAIVAASVGRRDYDRREQVSVSGRTLSGTVLRVAEREIEARIVATLGATSHWKTSTRATELNFTDNGSGYLNYQHRKISQEIEWTTDDWVVTIEGSARRVEYEVQTVGLGVAPPMRIRDDFAGRFRVERKLSPRWVAYAEYTWERNRCNDQFASYSMNEGLLGIRWNWEK